MQIKDAKKIVKAFPKVIEYINSNDLKAELEVWMKNSIWEIGSRQTIYNALAVEHWEDATLGERVILFEAYQMIKEIKEQPAVPATT